MIMEERREKSGEQQVRVVEEEEEAADDPVLPGFRFHPTDEELVGFYLRRKVEKKCFSIEIIREIDIYKHDPWDLPKVVSAREKEWYFFCLRGRKYRNSIRPNRVTGSGFWKATGIDRPIYSANDPGGDCIGLKKSLVYYRGSAGKGTKTDWMMHEYRLPCKNSDTATTTPSMHEAEIWTICRIFKRNTYRKSWKQSNNMKLPTDSSPKSSSFESDDGGNEFKFFASSSYLHEEEMKYVGNCFGEIEQTYGSQWNSTAQAPTPTLHSDAVSTTPSVNDFFRDGNWDELGRIVGFMTDQSVASCCQYP
ncbi:unnamed protein product [Musa textilis]